MHCSKCWFNSKREQDAGGSRQTFKGLLSVFQVFKIAAQLKTWQKLQGKNTVNSLKASVSNLTLASNEEEEVMGD